MTTIDALPLRLGSHTIGVITTLWDADKDCIAIAYDALLDHRTPALTATEARELARMLVAAADEINPLTVVR